LTLFQEKDLRGLLVSLSTIFAGLALIGIGTGNASGLIGSQFLLFSAALALALLGFSSEILRFRTRSYALADHAGALRQIPDLGTCAMLAIACGLGVPGTVGFVAFGLLLMGAFAYNPGIVIGTLVALVLVTGFLIQVYRGVFLGDAGEIRYGRLAVRERFLLLPITAAIVVAGFFPSPLVDSVRASVVTLLAGGGEIAPALPPEPEEAAPTPLPSLAPGEPPIPSPTPTPTAPAADAMIPPALPAKPTPSPTADAEAE
jgi:NADH-quinone oxidoreductase subunit M